MLRHLVQCFLALVLLTAGTYASEVIPPSALLVETSDKSTISEQVAGSVAWGLETDLNGAPVITAEVSIPPRDLVARVRFQHNMMADLPAMMLVEVEFLLGDNFTGGSVVGLMGILLKQDNQLGEPVMGASAKVMTNSFLFASSAAPQDWSDAADLLRSGDWVDLMIIYESGHRAVLSIRKDRLAQEQFNKAAVVWGK